jgi:hypothetical protein
MTLLAALVLLTGCPAPTQEGSKPASAPGPTNPTVAHLIADNLEKGKNAVPAPTQTLFACDFENAETNKLPDGFLVLDGAFAVCEESGNRLLELPGAPLDSFGVLFGPARTNGVSLYARVFGTHQGRRQPAFGVSLGGAGGLKLMVAPGKRLIELWRGDESLAQTPYLWESGQWTWMRLTLRPVGSDEWLAEGKAWKAGTPEPPAGLVSFRDKSELTPGRAGVWGNPIAGTPIRFDDLKLTSP